MRHSYLMSIASILLVAGCAAVNPNPNVGMRTTDLAFASGDCLSARKLAEPAALRGEPWAQFRMGALLIDKSCPNRSSKDALEAIEWLSKAACFESKSLWERGNELVVGPSGYFNARASSTKAAIMLADAYLHLQRAGLAWYYIDRARSQYAEGELPYNELTKQLTYIESQIGPDLFSKMKKEKPNLCISRQPSAQPNSQPDAAL
ncbi:hypothetical protein [Quatrionicoccus australiensis]|uniref:hypothetical protein n=1 Tax=Quatrionicoccus australiensis TaxID=138118 RepID=UPI001CFBC7D5|nr:hypothetical protein [Quatrionicoccus australiensis]MCB4358874.1 hypothetical protein [Quatrionicoccus australiensis]